MHIGRVDQIIGNGGDLNWVSKKHVVSSTFFKLKLTYKPVNSFEMKVSETRPKVVIIVAKNKLALGFKL